MNWFCLSLQSWEMGIEIKVQGAWMIQRTQTSMLVVLASRPAVMQANPARREVSCRRRDDVAAEAVPPSSMFRIS